MLPNLFNVMPVRDKKPLISWKHLTERAQNPEEKAAILEQGMPGSIGIVTGEVSNLFVLDIDGPEGEKSIEGKHIPRTWMVQTPHGRHYYFRWTSELDECVTTRAGVLDGVDVRGSGGYVVFYGWTISPAVAPLAAPPAWLVALLSKKEPKEVASGPLVVLGAIKTGNRNQSFASLAGGLRARGYSPEEMYAFLESKAKEVSFPLDELRAVCNSIGRYSPSLPIISPSEISQGESIEAFLVDEKPVEWICRPFIAESSIGFVAGLPETRKTFILFDLAIECARGGTWMGRFPVGQRNVLVIDQERAKSETQRRFKAMMLEKGVWPGDVKDRLFIRAGTTTRIDDQASFDALRKEISDLRPGLIIVDSLATFHNKNETSRMEIQQVMERIKQLRNEFGCAILFVHHETKGSFQNRKEGAEPSYLDMAGNVAIPAAAELVLNVVKHDEASSMVFHTKSTLGTKCAPYLVSVIDTAGGGIRVAAF